MLGVIDDRRSDIRRLGQNWIAVGWLSDEAGVCKLVQAVIQIHRLTEDITNDSRHAFPRYRRNSSIIQKGDRQDDGTRTNRQLIKPPRHC